MHHSKKGSRSSKKNSLNPEQIRLVDLITKEQALSAIRGLRAAVMGEYVGQDILLLNDIYGEPVPDHLREDLTPLLAEIRDSQIGQVSINGDGTSMMGEPVYLSYNGRTYVKGCLAGIPPTPIQSEIDANRGMLRLLAGMFSEGISAAFSHVLATNEQQAVEQELRLDRNRLAEVINNLGAGLMLIDKHMHITWHNPVVVEQFGIADLDGRLCYQVFHSRDGACEDCPVLRTFETGQVQSGGFASDYPGPARRFFDVTTTPIFDSKGCVSQVLQLIYDVTEKQLAIEERDRFFRNVSHELRTPLTSVLGFAELLKDSDEVLTIHQGRLIERINDNAQKMLGLVNDLLDLSKLEASQMRIRPGRVDLAKLISQVVDDLMPLAAEKNLALSIDMPAHSLNITTDASKVSHILINLISNAIKFTVQGGITISANKNSSLVRVDIKDTGVGISADELPLIFREFHQGIYQDKKQRGTGLGLSIAQRLAVLLGGEIEVQSKVDAGSTFTLNLPIQPAL